MRRAPRALAVPAMLVAAALMAMPPPAMAMYLTGGNNTTTRAVKPVLPVGSGGSVKPVSSVLSGGGFGSIGNIGSGYGSKANGGAGTVITKQSTSTSQTPTPSGGTLVSISSNTNTYVLGNAGACPTGDTCVSTWQNNFTGGSATRYGFTAVGSGVVGLGSVGQSVAQSQTQTTSIYNSNGQLVGVTQHTYNASSPNGFSSSNFANVNFGALNNLGATPSSGGNPAPTPGGGGGNPAPPAAGGGGSSIGTPPGGGAGIGTFTPTGGGNGPAGGGTGTPSGNGGSSGGGAPPALTFAIYPTVVLTDQPQVNSAAYGETLLAGVWAPAGYTITSVSMSFGDPRGDVNGQAPATICMGTPPGGGCQATVPEPTWSYHGDIAAAKFLEDWNSYYGFWDPSIGAGSNVNRTPDTFPVYATVTTVAPDGTTSTQTVEIPQFELMSSLTYPRVGPLEPIQDLSPILAQAQGGTYPAGSNGAASGGGSANGQAAQNSSAGTGGFIAAVRNDVAAAWNWMMQTLGFSSGSDLPPGAAVSVTQANG